MFMIWIIVALAMLTGAHELLGQDAAPVPQGPSSIALAANMSEYRQAVVTFARANPGFTGAVPAASLTPYLGANVANPIWRNYVQANTAYKGSLVVIYASATTARGVIVGMEQLAQGSALSGVASGANVISPGNWAVPLPASLANVIPNGMPVWMAQAYD
jgi:hypothetical protein